MSNMKAQYLTLPINHAYLTAGWKNPLYLAHWKYNHLGWDMVTASPSTSDPIYASGYGKVLSAGRDSKVGNVLAIQYYNAYNHKTGQTQDIIARYMHMDSLSVRAGSEVKAGTMLGKMGGTGARDDSYAIHLHIEFDYDVQHPNHSGQVSAGSIFKAGTSSSMANPAELFYIGSSQSLAKHQNAMCCQSDINIPAFPTGHIQPDLLGSQPQKLILPINNATVTAGYKNALYKNRFGFRHFGLDIIGHSLIYASGDGVVLACGLDSVLGNVIAVKYPNACNHKTKASSDIIMRYNHLSSIRVRKGQPVTKDTVLGVMGNTGKYSQGIHLHIEVDSDAREQYACWTPTLSGNGSIMKAGQDSTFHPAEILHVKTSAPDRQFIRHLYDGYSSDADTDMPQIQ